MKYKFIKIDDDNTELRYKDNSFIFKRDIELLRDLQGIGFRTKVSMMNELKKMGMTAKDLIVVSKEGNKTIEDHSNLLELEEYCRSIEVEKIYDNITMRFTKMTLAQLLVDIGIDVSDKNKDDILKFTEDIAKAITGQTETPSHEQKEG